MQIFSKAIFSHQHDMITFIATNIRHFSDNMPLVFLPLYAGFSSQVRCGLGWGFDSGGCPHFAWWAEARMVKLGGIPSSGYFEWPFLIFLDDFLYLTDICYIPFTRRRKIKIILSFFESPITGLNQVGKIKYADNQFVMFHLF